MTVCQTVSRSTQSYSWRRKLPIPLMFATACQDKGFPPLHPAE